MNTKRLFKLLLVSLGTSLFASCSDEKEELPCILPENNDGYISPAVPQGDIWIEATASRTEPFLGAGYDIMGSYIDNNSVKEPVLDLNKADIRSRSYTSGTMNIFTGRDITEFLQSINTSKNFAVPAENKDDLLCTATITGLMRFKELYDYSTQYTFVYNDLGASMSTKQLVSPKNQDWSSLLTDDFRKALELLSPEDIMTRYGTHILVEVQLGYTIKTLYCSIVADNESNLLNTARTGMYARRSTVYKSPNIPDTYPEKDVKKNYGGTIAISFQGGDFKRLPSINLTKDKREIIGGPMDISPWIQSAIEENCALTTLTENDLIPIYDVIADPVKKQLIKEAVIAHIKSHQPSIQQTAPIFQASDGNYHRYYTSYKELTAKADICQGVIGSVFIRHEPGTVPLYLSSDGENHRLSLEPTSNGAGKVIGYVYEKASDELNCIYEISDGKNFAYTTEEKDAYGDRSTWKPTGKSFYTKKV